jgi:methionyl-tRNA synthetase
MEKFKESYNADLANGLGNLSARIMTLAQANLSEAVNVKDEALPSAYIEALDAYDCNAATDFIWSLIKSLDGRLTTEKPFAVVKTEPDKGRTLIAECVTELNQIAVLLRPFMPKTSAAIEEAIKANRKPENLFPRK